MAGVRVVASTLDDPDIVALILALNAELAARYPEPGANHFRLDPDEVAPGRGAVMIARIDERPVGCGAVRLIAPDTAEIKRMYTAPEARGRGVARGMLAALEAEARRLGASRVVLETGERQGEAIKLYEKAGYARIDLYGEYVGAPHSLCMGKSLS